MKIKNISISLGRTVNLGNFNSIKTEISIEANVGSENYDKEIEELQSVCEYNLDKIINKRIQKIRSPNSSNPTEQDNSNPTEQERFVHGLW